MMVFVIPDIHMKPWMLDAADVLIRQTHPDQIVCLGDIADDFGMQHNPDAYRQMFDRAIRFAKEHPEMLWCFGNHDISYIWEMPETGMAEFDTKQMAEKCVRTFVEAVPEGHLAFVHKIDDVLFSHAGISRMFVREQCGTSCYNNTDAVVTAINNMRAEQLWYNDSPIWLRPQKEYRHFPIQLYKPRVCFQVVGHSPMQKITQEKNLLSCDVFSTYPDGSRFGSEEFVLLDVGTHTWKGIPARRSAQRN